MYEIYITSDPVDVRPRQLLDALERLDLSANGAAAAIARFVEALGAGARTRGPSAGLGEDVRVAGTRVIGSGLELGGELLQLSAFTSSGEGAPTGRIARPSRRRVL